MKTDVQSCADVLDELSTESRLPVDRAFVRSLGGAVTPSGRLSSFDAKQFADGTIKRVSQVTSFESQIAFRRDDPDAYLTI